MSHRQQIKVIMRAALAAADPRGAVERALRIEGDELLVTGAADPEAVDLAETRRIWLLGAGKAAAAMTRGALEVLGSRVAGGSVTVPLGSTIALGNTVDPGKLDVWEAGHPVPDVGGLAGAANALQLAGAAGEGDLVVCLLSGGASALWAAPSEGVTLDDLRQVTSALLRAGAPIAEMNAVRKHLSLIAGGRLARAAAPAAVLTLAISDVIGVAPDVIGSGPTLPDRSTFSDALRIVRERDIELPTGVLDHLRAGVAGQRSETAKAGELANLSGFHVILDVRDALDGAARACEELGYHVIRVADDIEGEARDLGSAVVARALQARDEVAGPIALLWGGESTVTVRGNGSGGRNQELATAAAIALDGHDGVTIASFGTDGRDGDTTAAGAVVDGGTAARGRAAGLDPESYLMNNDSNSFLAATGDLLITGRTGTNVNDLVIALLSGPTNQGS